MLHLADMSQICNIDWSPIRLIYAIFAAVKKKVWNRNITIMKKFLFTILALAAFAVSYAQKSSTRIQDTQARLLDVTSNAYVHPLTVELQVIESAGRIRDVWPLTREQAEVEMQGDIVNIRSYGVFMSSKKHNADVIVAATFNFHTTDDGKGYEIEVVGFPAIFTKWATAKPTDYEWIRMEKVQTTDDRDRLKALVKQ